MQNTYIVKNLAQVCATGDFCKFENFKFQCFMNNYCWILQKCAENFENFTMVHRMGGQPDALASGPSEQFSENSLGTS